jgi:hypothetical protein
MPISSGTDDARSGAGRKPLVVMSTNPLTPLTANVPRSQSDELVTHWYGWFFLVSSLFWPRLCLVGFWIFGSFMADAFDHHWILQVVGFLVLPWTTMVYALMWALTSDGVFGWEWICVALALLLDLLTWGLGRSLVRGLRG